MGKTKSYPGIYQILNIQNKKSYIGYSRSCLKRMQCHRNYLRGNKHKNPHLQNAWNSYGSDNFIYRIIENLDDSLTNEQFEEIETKWVLHFKSHLSEFGYNSVIPGFVPLIEEGKNTTQRKIIEYSCINTLSGEIINLSGKQEVTKTTSISPNKIEDLCSYWKGKTKRKSLHGWIIIKKDEYDPKFDYIGYKKEKEHKKYKYGSKLTSAEYYRKRKYIDPSYQRSRKEDIVPYEDRNLKRCSVIAHNISTGEERIFSMIKNCSDEFMPHKVYKCINASFGKYKHRGHYFRRLGNDPIPGV